jgi:pimeloyl-ACP methyl ester carboxylesterase
MGGFVAQRLAQRAPALVERLVLLASDPGGAASVPAEPTAWAQLLDHSGSAREQATRLIALLFPPALAPQIDDRFGAIVALARSGLSLRTLAAQEAAMIAWHLQEQPRPGGDAPPVLVAHGSEDVVIPPANADALAARWPSAQVERFDGGGHAFMAQEPLRLAELIVSFARG